MDIKDVEVSDLTVIPDERGNVKHFVTEHNIGHFGECYITQVYDGIRKGWHGYSTKTLRYCVPQGMVRLALWDSRKNSPTYNQTMTLFLGDVLYQMVLVPPGVFNAFKGIARPVSTIVVVASEVFSESRIIRKPIDSPEIPYDWDVK